MADVSFKGTSLRPYIHLRPRLQGILLNGVSHCHQAQSLHPQKPVSCCLVVVVMVVMMMIDSGSSISRHRRWYEAFEKLHVAFLLPHF